MAKSSILDTFNKAAEAHTEDSKSEKSAQSILDTFQKASEEHIPEEKSTVDNIKETGEDFARKFGAEASFGLSDEAAGAVDAVKAALTGGNAKEAYTKGKQEHLDKLHNSEERSPIASKLAIGASMLVPGLGVAKEATLGARLIKGALAGSASGALSGFGNSEASITDPSSLPQLAKDTAIGGTVGGVVGGAGTAAIEAIGKGIQKGSQLLKDLKLGSDPIEAIRSYLGAKPIIIDTKKNKLATGAQNQAIDILDKAGLFQSGEVGLNASTQTFEKVKKGILPPSPEEFNNRLNHSREVLGEAIGDIIDTADHFIKHEKVPVKVNDVSMDATFSFLKKAKEAGADVNPAIKAIERRVEAINNATSVKELQAIKQSIYGELKDPYFTQAQPSIAKDALATLAQDVKGKIESVTNELAPIIANNPAYADKAALLANTQKINQMYGSIEEVAKMAKFKNYANFGPGNVGAGVAGTMVSGNPAVGVIAGIGRRLTQMPQAPLIKQQLMEKVQEIPRSVAKVGDFFQRLQPQIQQMNPNLARIAAAYTAAKNSEEKQAVLQQASAQNPELFQKSDYSSLIDGKISAPADKMKYIQNVKERTKDPIEQARLLSKFNKDGSIGQDYLDKPEEEEDIEANSPLNQFTNHVRGY